MTQQLSFAKTFIFLTETSPQQTTVFAATTTPMNLSQLFAAYTPQTQGQAIRFKVDKPLLEASESIVASVHSQLSKFNT
jgi:hypothetical protein